MPESASTNTTSAGSGAAPPTTGTSAPPDSPAAHKTGAVKDKNCPYCGQAFTSSSLGRHLDLYIKEKNPKPPDGIHDVDAIRKLREGITRRQPRGSHARRDRDRERDLDASNPGTPASSSRKSPAPAATSAAPDPVRPPAIPKEGQYVVDSQINRFPFQASWEATGVINDIPLTTGNHGSGIGTTWDSLRAGASPGRDMSARPQRVPSRAAQKMQLDTKQRLADAVDTARAAELALRELLSSMRAAKYVSSPLFCLCLSCSK